MASASNDGLPRLQHLSRDEYIIAFGPEGRQFIGAPTGWAANNLPQTMCDDLVKRDIKKVIWASFGDEPDSWFFTYETPDGTVIRLGNGAPNAVRQFIKRIHANQEVVTGAIRVQLGAERSFLAWCGDEWFCRGLDPDLMLKLREESSGTAACSGGCFKGRLLSDGDSRLARSVSFPARAGSGDAASVRLDVGIQAFSSERPTIQNVQWLQDGSYFLVIGTRFHWSFRRTLVSRQWSRLWNGNLCSGAMKTALHSLAHVALDPHSTTSDTFAFLLKQNGDENVPFVLRFGMEPVYARLPLRGDHKGHSLQIGQPKQPGTMRWAISKSTGRPHPNDQSEVLLKKGERIRVVEYVGRDWYKAIGRDGSKGYVHGSWLDFVDHSDGQEPSRHQASAAYECFHEFVQSLQPGQLESFPMMSDFWEKCQKEECKPLKAARSLLGVCIHDMEELLKGSGEYSFEWLKEGRNMWHPDRFARFCVPERADEIKPKAQEMFVIYGILMEMV